MSDDSFARDFRVNKDMHPPWQTEPEILANEQETAPTPPPRSSSKAQEYQAYALPVEPIQPLHRLSSRAQEYEDYRLQASLLQTQKVKAKNAYYEEYTLPANLPSEQNLEAPGLSHAVNSGHKSRFNAKSYPSEYEEHLFFQKRPAQDDKISLQGFYNDPVDAQPTKGFHKGFSQEKVYGEIAQGYMDKRYNTYTIEAEVHDTPTENSFESNSKESRSNSVGRSLKHDTKNTLTHLKGQNNTGDFLYYHPGSRERQQAISNRDRKRSKDDHKQGSDAMHMVAMSSRKIYKKNAGPATSRTGTYKVQRHTSHLVDINVSENLNSMNYYLEPDDIKQEERNHYSTVYGTKGDTSDMDQSRMSKVRSQEHSSNTLNNEHSQIDQHYETVDYSENLTQAPLRQHPRLPSPYDYIAQTNSEKQSADRIVTTEARSKLDSLSNAKKSTSSGQRNAAKKEKNSTAHETSSSIIYVPTNRARDQYKSLYANTIPANSSSVTTIPSLGLDRETLGPVTLQTELVAANTIIPGMRTISSGHNEPDLTLTRSIATNEQRNQSMSKAARFKSFLKRRCPLYYDEGYRRKYFHPIFTLVFCVGLVVWSFVSLKEIIELNKMTETKQFEHIATTAQRKFIAFFPYYFALDLFATLAFLIMNFTMLIRVKKLTYIALHSFIRVLGVSLIICASWIRLQLQTPNN